ncbi:MAG: filamentous hemagglutinin N-terminal domain-containing protein [bacterium]
MIFTQRLTRRSRTVALIAAAHVMFCHATPLLALPKGETVANGEVAFTREGDTMTVLQTSQNAIVNYDSFSIGSPESVQFIQPDSSAAILNRVTGSESSVLAGVLMANGNVYLINPNGILFTPSARISVASLFASALDITDEDFAAGRMLFTGQGSGSVVNQGEITAEDRACLFGSVVDNSGTIRAGTVMMAAAAGSIEIDNAAGGAIRLLVDGRCLDKAPAPESDAGEDTPPVGTTPETPPTDQPDSTGQTATPDQAVQPPTSDAGMVINQGTVSVSGNVGGSVAMSGTRVGQFGVVNADGTAGTGGTVTITASDTVALGDDSVTTANAGTDGNGGTVIVYSPGSALFRRGAVIEARAAKAPATADLSKSPVAHTWKSSELSTHHQKTASPEHS